MDAVMKTAVCEIAKIFEGSLCEQQLELTQRVEEISMLRGKLDKVERRLRGDAEEGKRIPAVELHVDVETFSKNISTMMTDPDTRDDGNLKRFVCHCWMKDGLVGVITHLVCYVYHFCLFAFLTFGLFHFLFDAHTCVCACACLCVCTQFLTTGALLSRVMSWWPRPPMADRRTSVPA